MTFSLEISDHSVLRWLERRHGMDIDKIRAEIHAAAYPAASVGATRVSVHGVTIIIRDDRYGAGKIVTSIMPCGSPGTARLSTALATGRQPSQQNITRQELGKIRRRRRQQKGNG